MTKELFERRLFNLYAEIELPVRVWGYRYGTPEYWKQLEKELEYEAKELEEFIRDHRSRDYYGINVRKEYQYICKFCGHEFPDGFNGIADCCDKMIEAQETSIEDLHYNYFETK